MDTKGYPISWEDSQVFTERIDRAGTEVWVRSPGTENTSWLVFGREGVYKLGLAGCVGVLQSKW